ncbi:NAD-dependent epimerase/dehydratase family protein [Solimonas sp. K1W22B-7]|uniref:NAD-dependent epimerase/dehydratase family protein n=1 Tax=Solimonas sp. K1W22B-7 TaxID=2303331 RepID=UPI0013C475A0|nr:NAD(P)-dependent oxidoreductase [Solimonas sp. K1W22B-7]
MSLFLTGGTGFIGSHLLRQALESGREVVALRRPGSRPKLAMVAEPLWRETPFDQLTPEDFRGCTALVHLASVGVSPQKATWQEMMYWNVSATLRMLEQAHAAGVKRVVMAGTFAEYGRAADHYDPIPPDAPLLPTYGYAASKAAAFTAAHAFAIEHGMELCYLRIFSAFGEGQFAANFWPALKEAAESGRDFDMTPGEQVRDYVPVEMVARAFLHAAGRADMSSAQPFVRNVGAGHPVSMREFAEHWWRQWGATGELRVGALPYRANEVMRFVPQILGDEIEVS